ncbi:alpha/beta fold hydrolase [Methylobacterium isbiliense]|jgi:pimeloyl-ACP methyl ester carboxylesterase|uniref:Haloalkane dehalogenase n=1 Tax=Methylobacterium isbiliense TaxID=315478 RepID=A0ABQ4SLQ3_9HYPH|nr:alpha/beta fold hydrolase [Methylobacterium isbiliense]MDN3624755.1 alpha/beta fold hydrolase [Methylobacterium isbiliense]GJE02673.1 Haloalkane dehalogenase [Methylobacterium isbiliense]
MAERGAAGEVFTFVLVHGAWHGGWCWRRVADRLRAGGHRVFAPTCTGLGERAHLLARGITLATFVRDIAGVIEAEELADVVLVGHSFGGLAISGVADLMPEAIRHLVYLDALLVEPGRAPFDVLPPEVVADRRRAAEETSGSVSLPVPPPAAFGVFDPQDAAWLARRLTPHPLGTYESPLALASPVGNGLPRTYVACAAPAYPALDGVKAWVRRQEGWGWREIETGHDAMVSAPDAVVALLLDLARARPRDGRLSPS